MNLKYLAGVSTVVWLLVASQLPFAQPARAADDAAAAATNASPVSPTDFAAPSVVKVFSTTRYPDIYRPWTKQSPEDETGSGVVIQGQRILTCAHVVLYASQVQIQANQAGDKISATVEYVAPGIDLAVLKVDDDSFFTNHPALPFDESLPDTKDAVMVYGYPEGGTSLSITKGIVSRTEFVSYNFPVSGLRIQIDAAVNPGNSGGPAVVGNKMIGLAFSHLNDSQNISYIIPCEEISLFLNDIADGHYDGKPAMYEELQTLENPALRPFLKIDKSVEGIIVHHPASSEESYPLKEWDVITKIADVPVDDQGMVKVGNNLRVHFTYMIQKVAKNGELPLTIVRGGKEMQIQLPVSARYPTVTPDLGNGYPSYFIYGPMVFSTCTEQFVRGMTGGERALFRLRLLSARKSPLLTRIGDHPTFDGEELVVVPSPFFPHKLVEGYEAPFGQVVDSINGIHVRNLSHLVQILRDSHDEFLKIAFAGRDTETMIFPRAAMSAATDEILSDNGVRSRGSADMIAIWNADPAGVTPKN